MDDTRRANAPKRNSRALTHQRIRETYAANLRKLRIEGGISIDRMVDVTGIPKKSWILLEQSKRHLRLSEAVLIAKFFGIDLVDLIRPTRKRSAA